MVEKAVSYLVDFAAATLHHILVRKVSHDIAFKSALRDVPKAPQYLKLKTLYRVSRMIVLDYYLLREASRRVYGGEKQPSRRLARLWLLLRHDYVVEVDPSLETGVERLRRKLLRTMPKRVESVDELLDSIEDPVKRLAIRHSYPYWFAERMVHLLGYEAAEALLASLNEEQWWIRVNTLKTDVDTVAERLEEKGVIVQRDPDLPYMLRVVDYNEPLHHLEEMWTGEIVFQDKASAMVVEALEPEPGDIILDLAAAPGVKDTLIAQLTGGRVRIVAVDVSYKRSLRILKLLKLYGVGGVEADVVNADARQLPLTLTPTKVLLDAPCTSSGAVGKDPAIKIHLEDREWVSRFPPIQAQLLKAALSFRAVTVYATCSLLPEENELLIYDVMVEAKGVYEEHLPGIYEPSPYMPGARRSWPHLHRTGGMFYAMLVKV